MNLRSLARMTVLEECKILKQKHNEQQELPFFFHIVGNAVGGFFYKPVANLKSNIAAIFQLGRYLLKLQMQMSCGSSDLHELKQNRT